MRLANATGNLLEEDFLRHVLAVVGLRHASGGSGIRLRVRPAELGQDDRRHVESGGVLLAVQPGEAFCTIAGLQRRCGLPPADFAVLHESGSRITLRTLHANDRYAGAAEPILLDEADGLVWAKVPIGRGFIVVAGTDLAADLMRFRQGDPDAASSRPQESLWDIAGERPIYLFERQLQGLSRRDERQADFWAMHAARVSADAAGLQLAPVLPAGAAGAVVITGDDDQAFLDKYAAQLRLLEGLPITYFLHPKTRHTPESMTRLFGGRDIELGIHPDALEAPGDYCRLLQEQCDWFRGLTGSAAVSVRNHGFLNDGYWGHLPHWLQQEIRISSNLPGLDGRPLNGSFLPAQLAFGGRLTDHWSIVTSIGDGLRYVNGGRSDEAAAQYIHDCADQIRWSRIPGVIVLNLHPQNVDDTRAMHAAAAEVIRSGFHPWTLRDCLGWFEQAVATPRPSRAFDRVLTGLSKVLARRNGKGDAMRRPA